MGGVAELIQRQVDAQMEALEQKLVTEMAAQGREMIGTATAVLADKLGERVQSLERDAASQLRELSRVQESSSLTASQIESAVNAVQDRLSDVIPASIPRAWGPSLVSSQSSAPRTTPPPVRSPRNQRAVTRSCYACPKCNSSDVRPSTPDGFYEYFLGLFFVRPVRCQRCLRRFLRF